MPAIALTFFFALFWSALFEIPSAKVEMIFLGGARGRKPSQQQAKEVEEAFAPNQLSNTVVPKKFRLNYGNLPSTKAPEDGWA